MAFDHSRMAFWRVSSRVFLSFDLFRRHSSGTMEFELYLKQFHLVAGR
jgi:hypothetical protein